MSRIGMKPIPVPASVEVKISPEKVEVKGPKGTLETRIPFRIKVELKDGRIIVSRESEDKQTKSFHGLTRALINNTVIGVTEGFKKQLKIVGVGYRAEVKGKNLEMLLGFSHPVIFPIPADVSINVEPKENLLSLLADFFYTPILEVGKWLSEKFSRLNVFIFILDFIIEAPFKVFVEIADEWSKYVKERREEIG